MRAPSDAYAALPDGGILSVSSPLDPWIAKPHFLVHLVVSVEPAAPPSFGFSFYIFLSVVWLEEQQSSQPGFQSTQLIRPL